MENGNKKITHLDDVLVQFNLLDRFHIQTIILIFTTNLFNCLQYSQYVFTAEEVKYRCKDERFVNNTCTSLGNSNEFCTEWVYDDPHSFVAEFQLACQEWKRTLVGTVHSFGYMVGLLITGPLSDRFGRKRMIVINGIIGAILGLARSFAPWYWLVLVLQFLEPAIGDVFSSAFIMTMEIVAHEKRVINKTVCGFGFSFGYGVIALLAWLFPYWRLLLQVIYTPALLIIFYAFLLDESPRWLLSKGRKDEAITILKKMAKKNKLEIKEEVLDNIWFEKESKVASFPELLKITFKSKLLLKRFLMCIAWWITSTFIHFGMRINSVLLPGNKYVNFALLAVTDLISKIANSFILLRFGRKLPLIYSFMFTAIFLITQPFVPAHLPWLSVILFMIGIMMVSAFYGTTYIFTSELFPTYTRNSMHALCSSIGRIGSLIAPQTPLLIVYWSGLPSFVFGMAALAAGILTLWAPNTADNALPDNVRQAEKLGEKTIIFNNDENVKPSSVICEKNTTPL